MSFLGKPPSPFVCSNAMPGVGCNYPENIFQGGLHLLSGIFCFVSFIRYCRKERNSSDFILLKVIFYWLFSSVWFIYRGITWMIPFDYTITEFLFFYIGVNQLLFIIPLSILMLILSELVYLPNTSGISLNLIRILFVVFLSAFLITGAAISTIKPKPESENIRYVCQTGLPIYLWSGCVYLVIFLFVSIPATKLIRSISDPIVQPHERSCVNLSKVSLIIFIVLQLCRTGFSFSRYFIRNPIADCSCAADSSLSSRICTFCYYFIFDLCIMWIANGTIIYINKIYLIFTDFPYYIRTQA